MKETRSFPVPYSLFPVPLFLNWGEHSLSEQRFYNILCLVYGSNPEKFNFLVEDGDLPEERAEICPSEYERKVNSWDTLLSPYWK